VLVVGSILHGDHYSNGCHVCCIVITGSPTGLSRVDGVHRIVVLKHETSTLRQSHNLISIDFTFGVGDYVREATRLAEVGSDPMSGRDATWGQHIRDL